MVLLKSEFKGRLDAIYENLHSSMVLLKSYTLPLKELSKYAFTFQYGST